MKLKTKTKRVQILSCVSATVGVRGESYIQYLKKTLINNKFLHSVCPTSDKTTKNKCTLNR